MRKGLTGRQTAFTRYYAITGNGVRSARLAGYRDGRGLRTTASRLLRDADICAQIALLRDSAFDDLRARVSLQLEDAILPAMQGVVGCRAAQRALRFATKVGLFAYQNSVAAEIETLEERFGLSFETIIDVVFAAGFLDDFSEDAFARDRLRTLATKAEQEQDDQDAILDLYRRTQEAEEGAG